MGKSVKKSLKNAAKKQRTSTRKKSKTNERGFFDLWKWFVPNAVLRNMTAFYVWDVGIKQMNKKGQVAGLIVFIVLTLVGLATIGMFEAESGFISHTIGEFKEESDSSSANLLINLVVPAFFLVSIVGALLVIRGATFG